LNDSEFQISLKCLFCGCDLKGDTEKKPTSGDMLKCQDCGELNDYDSLLEIAIEEGKALEIKAIKDDLSKSLKGLFK
jgi:hypothetical protein